MTAPRFAQINLFLGVSLAAMSSQAVLAQSAFPSLDTAATAAQNEEEGEDNRVIIVTGQKISRSIQDTPASVAIVDEQAIEQQNIINLNDVLERTANVTGGASSFNIRGINSNRVSGQGLAGLATIYVDGSPLPPEANRGPSSLDVWDVSQVEILRGPQSTLQGRNALAGAIIINTADPEYDWSGRARAIYQTNYDEVRLAGAVGGPIVDGQVAFRVAGEYSKSDGIIANPTLGGNNDEADSYFVRGKLLIEPDFAPDLRVLLSYLRDERNSGSTFGDVNVDDANDNRQVFLNRQTVDNVDVDILIGRIDYDFTDTLSLTSVSALNWATTRLERDLDYTPADDSFSDFNNRSKIFSQETRLQYDGDRLQGVLGVYYQKVDNSRRDGFSQFGFDIQRNFNVPALLQAQFGLDAATANLVNSFYLEPVPLRSGFDNPFEIESYALFSDFSFDVSDAITLYGGFRWDRESQEIQTGSEISVAGDLPDPASFQGPLAPIAPIIAGVNGFLIAQATAANADPVRVTSPTFSAFLPKFGIGWNIDDDRSLNFTVQRGYRSGGVGVNSARGSSFSFDQEFIWNYEAAFRSAWLDNTLFVNANAYYIDWTDQQVEVQLSGNTFDSETQNAGSSRLWGFEVESRYEASGDLDFYASAGYANTEFTNFIASTDAGAVDLAGNEFRRAPQWTFAGGATYENIDGITVNVNGNYRSAAFSQVQVQNDRDLHGYFVANFRAGWQNDNFGVFLTGSNIFDRDIRDGLIELPDANGDLQPRVEFFGEPRTFSLQLEAKF